MKRAAVYLAGALMFVCLFTVDAAAAKKAKVTIHNNSKWDIHHFFLSASEDDEWGPDQLGDDVLESHGAFTLNAIPCDTYDVKLVDEDGDECVVEEVDICGGHDAWSITNQDLLDCEGY